MPLADSHQQRAAAGSGKLPAAQSGITLHHLGCRMAIGIAEAGRIEHPGGLYRSHPGRGGPLLRPMMGSNQHIQTRRGAQGISQVIQVDAFQVARQQQPPAATLDQDHAACRIAGPSRWRMQNGKAHIIPPPMHAGPAGYAIGQPRMRLAQHHPGGSHGLGDCSKPTAVIPVVVAEDHSIEAGDAPAAQVGDHHPHPGIAATEARRSGIVEQTMRRRLHQHRQSLPHIQHRHAHIPCCRRCFPPGEQQRRQQHHGKTAQWDAAGRQGQQTAQTSQQHRPQRRLRQGPYPPGMPGQPVQPGPGPIHASGKLPKHPPCPRRIQTQRQCSKQRQGCQQERTHRHGNEVQGSAQQGDAPQQPGRHRCEPQRHGDLVTQQRAHVSGALHPARHPIAQEGHRSKRQGKAGQAHCSWVHHQHHDGRQRQDATGTHPTAHPQHQQQGKRHDHRPARGNGPARQCPIGHHHGHGRPGRPALCWQAQCQGMKPTDHEPRQKKAHRRHHGHVLARDRNEMTQVQVVEHVEGRRIEPSLVADGQRPDDATPRRARQHAIQPAAQRRPQGKAGLCSPAGGQGMGFLSGAHRADGGNVLGLCKLGGIPKPRVAQGMGSAQRGLNLPA